MIPHIVYYWGVIASGTWGMKMADILNAEYLPSTLMIEGAEIDNSVGSYSNVSTDGEIKDAFATMNYHRAKMNEFLCRSYVADEILAELEPQTIARLGTPLQKNHKNHKPQESLLRDQGSSSYRDWLSRSTLLDDVYRHYDTMDHDDSEAAGTQLESGEVTGYAIESSGAKSPGWGPSIYGAGAGDYGGGGVYPSHNNEYIPEHQGGGDEHHYYYHQEEHGKGVAVKELFDLALTALAFLAFGLFIMNLIMTCLVGSPPATVFMTTMTTVTSTAEATAKKQASRSLLDDNSLNEMAYRVLTTIDELKKSYGGQPENRNECFKYTLCRNNKYSRSLNGAKRLWLPVWSFGLSWLAGKLGEDRLGSLQASVLGLGDADCGNTYPACQRSTWI